MNDISQTIEDIEYIAAKRLNIFEMDRKLKQAFSQLYHKRTLYKNNFINLKRLTGFLMTHQLWFFSNQVDCIGLSYSMEHDLATMTETLRDRIETRETCPMVTFEETAFLAVLHLYRTGVREMDKYQEGVREFLKVARIQYDDILHHHMTAEEKLSSPSYEKFLSNFHCTNVTFVASHGIIDENHLHMNHIGLMGTAME